MVDKNSILKNTFANSSMKSPTDTVGFGLAEEGVSYYSLEEFPIQAIICSTNNDGAKPMPQFIKATCDTTARGNEEFNGGKNTNIRAMCPGNCLKSGFAEVFGT